jgi:hypothetical protein
LADALARVEDRYSAAAYALDQFSRELESEQSLNAQLLEEALAAEQARTSALDAVWKQGIQAERDRRDPDLSEAAARKHQTALQEAQAQFEDAKSALTEAKKKIQASEDRVSQAASDAAGQLKAAIDADGLTENWFQRVGNWVENRAQWVWENIDSISCWLNIAALVLCWVPGLNVVLRVAATIADVLSTVKDVIDLINGEGSLLDVALDVFGFLSLGVGRIITKGFQRAHQALKVSQKATAGVRAKSVKAAAKTQGILDGTIKNRANLSQDELRTIQARQSKKATSAVAVGKVQVNVKGKLIRKANEPPSWRDASKGWTDDLLGLKELKANSIKPKDLPKKVLENLNRINPFRDGFEFTRPILLDLSSDAASTIRTSFEAWRAAQVLNQGFDAYQTWDQAVTVVRDFEKIGKAIKDVLTPDRT